MYGPTRFCARPGQRCSWGWTWIWCGPSSSTRTCAGTRCGSISRTTALAAGRAVEPGPRGVDRARRECRVQPAGRTQHRADVSQRQVSHRCPCARRSTGTARVRGSCAEGSTRSPRRRRGDAPAPGRGSGVRGCGSVPAHRDAWSRASAAWSHHSRVTSHRLARNGELPLTGSLGCCCRTRFRFALPSPNGG